MRGSILGHASGRLAALLLIAAALLMRVAVPGGWMPDASAHGFGIMPCPGVAPAPMSMHGMMHHDGGKHQHESATQSPCDFAGAAHAAALPDIAPAPALAPALVPRASIATLIAAAPGRGLAAPPPPSTGPPLA